MDIIGFFGCARLAFRIIGVAYCDLNIEKEWLKMHYIVTLEGPNGRLVELSGRCCIDVGWV